LYISPDRRSEHLVPLQYALGVDNESASGLDTRFLVVDSVDRSYLASRIGEHGEGDATLDHVRQLVVIPHFVNEYAVNAHGETLDIEPLELGILFSNC